MYAATGISKRYGGVQALDDVDLDIRAGQVHALLGANGAGKSTLMKILVGAERPTAGSLRLAGTPVHFDDVGHAADHGVAIVSQELNLFPDLSVVDNLFLQREPLRRRVLVNRAEMIRLARPVVEAIGLTVSLHRKVGELRLGEQQLVEIARAMLGDPRILFLDEPTSALQASETKRLLDVVRTLRDRGVGIVYVSHILEDVFAIADTVTILRNGRIAVSAARRDDLTMRGVVTHMLGEATSNPKEEDAAVSTRRSLATPSRASLRLAGVTVAHQLDAFDLEAHPGEIVGLAGLEGSGVRAVYQVIFGQRRAGAGTVTLPNGDPAPATVTRAVRSGVALIPSDRRRFGVMLDKAIFENVATVRSGPLRRAGVFPRVSRLIERAGQWTHKLRVDTQSLRSPVAWLSGGNQQKVLFAKWLEAEPTLVLLDDPTRGVDVLAKSEMHTFITETARSGRVVLMTSSDLKELTTVCDRVVVMFQGRALGELRGDQLTVHRLLEAINTGDVGHVPDPRDPR